MDKYDIFMLGCFGMFVAILLSGLIFGGCLIQPYMEYKVKMEMVKVASKAVDKGLELRLNGDLLKGVELVKITKD